MNQTTKYFSLLLILLLAACQSKTPTPPNPIIQTVDNFYKLYSEREDFDKFMSFYADTIVLEDIISGHRIEGKKGLRVFLEWNNPSFEKIGATNLKVYEKIIDKNKAVIKGHFNPFKWDQTQFEAMHFTTILTFNKDGKIVKHVDWINYPTTLVNYEARSNSNEWVER